MQRLMSPPRSSTVRNIVKRLGRLRVIYFLLLLLVNTAAFANSLPQYLVVPACLLSSKFNYLSLAQSQQLHLIKVNDFEAFQAVRIKQPLSCRGFINVTSAWMANIKKDPTTFLQPYLPANNALNFVAGNKIKYSNIVNSFLPKANADKIKTNLQALTKWPDRHANTANGLHTAQWIFDALNKMVQGRQQDDVEIYMIPTINHIKQPSIVAKIGKDLLGPGIVIGTHMDTLKYQMRGAANNASGVATMLETARVLLSSQLTFKKPIYLIWYAGLEEGILGSQSVVQAFNRHNINVDAVLQVDDTGFIGKGDLSIGLTDDLTDTGLTTFVADLVTTYLQLPVGAISCGYACSDHISWYQNGNRVAYPFATMYDDSHAFLMRTQHKFTALSVRHMLDFVKLALAFAIELAEPV